MVYEIIKDIIEDNELLITIGTYLIIKNIINEFLNYYDYI